MTLWNVFLAEAFSQSKYSAEFKWVLKAKGEMA